MSANRGQVSSRGFGLVPVRWRQCFFCLIVVMLSQTQALREFRSWSIRQGCLMAENANYPFAMEKYAGMEYEGKGRVNSNKQDFRHSCQVLGGKSKCNLCEDIDCASTKDSTCFLQLQGVDGKNMSKNIPTITDTAWAVGGTHRKDWGGSSVSHYCVFLGHDECVIPSTTDFSACTVRCFGNLASIVTSPAPAKLGQASNRSIVDLHDGMGRWNEDGQVDLWQYPKNCDELNSHQGTACTYGGNSGSQPSFNPQGFTFTQAGNGTAGFADGDSTTAMFRAPDDVAADQYGWLYVADTMNNAIRMVHNVTGVVSTLAGRGPDTKGPRDGNCSYATFTEPRGLDVEVRDIDGFETTVVVVADTGNHRIRRINYVRHTGECEVVCLSGLCGNNTLSFTQYNTKATPYTGYADGNGLESRFSAPEGVAFMDGHAVAVADTGNFLIRYILDNGTTSTLAGRVVPGQTGPDGNPAGGCQPPCLEGQEGFFDGNLTHAMFMNPVDLTRGTNNTLYITDEHRIRLIEMPNVNTTLYTHESQGRVSTVVGTGRQGHEDGLAKDGATVFNPSGVTVTADSRVYFVDSASCRVRRLTPLPLVVEELTCLDTVTKYMRPSGCTSFDQPIDLTGRKITRTEANIQYNYGKPDGNNTDVGKFIKNCVGVPPFDYLDKHFVDVTGDNLVIDDKRSEVNEDSEQGMSMLFHCPKDCNLQIAGATLEGTEWYSQETSVCIAAIHAGLLTGPAGGYIRATVQRRAYLNNTDLRTYSRGSVSGLTSQDIPADSARIFNLKKHAISDRMLHTVGGAPAADLESGCGYVDSQPATLAYFNKPKGITARPNVDITDDEFLYIADTANNRIRGLSAVCTQICENGGICTASDTCTCPTGWTGIDCTLLASDACPTGCGTNEVCTGPNSCTCKPGYTGTNCDEPQCVQSCYNGGLCTAPDTCTCASGWFDSNCTTPVCTNTCANGGNCTAPNTCACPEQWTGSDCRTPVCTQTCLNGGRCVAPDTCICPPQWINYDCSVPVCTQGYFMPNPSEHKYSTSLEAWPTYRQCNRIQYCNWTKEFECDQMRATFGAIEVPSGPVNRAVTGRKERPNQCMNIELPTTYKLPFELANADGTSTGVRRYSPVSPYETDPANEWRGYLSPTDNHTGPWEYSPDRQIAQVEWVNISQGVYVCANGGNCTAPGICECAPGWMGFDCRTPICFQGYYFPNQEKYVSGEESENELSSFSQYMDRNNSYNLSWPYSNPNYTTQWEFYLNESYVHREIRDHGNERYLAEPDWSSLDYSVRYQGGYRCSIRSISEWENQSYLFDHPNYYSRYMDRKIEVDGGIYTHWVNMSWPATYQRSRPLDKEFLNVSYAYTNNGWRRGGIWNITENVWQYGRCIIQFQRNCSDRKKQYDLQSQLYHKIVQDTDLAYRPRVYYNDLRVEDPEGSMWKEEGGECTDLVHRGCYNNGTCVAPDTCQCAEGWGGIDCRYPTCSQTCNHHGNCTQPDTCTCERGWIGDDCSEPVCAQDCLNDGVCVAPDTCKCVQWENTFRDGRQGGGKPLYQDPYGNPLRTGWTGYDCSVPICVQASSFYVNVAGKYADGFESLGGHGGDHLLTCEDDEGNLMPRCPDYDIYVTGNEGTTFQGGCGNDPYDTGCCIATSDTAIECYTCPDSKSFATNNTFFCQGEYTTLTGLNTELDKFADFLDEFGHFLMCGTYHRPRYHDPLVEPQDYGIVKYYTDYLDRDEYSNRNYLNNLTSNRFLCNLRYWEQGDYVDDAGYGDEQGLGSIHGLDEGRHYRINYANMIQLDADSWEVGNVTRGEGVFACENSGSCLAPDLCSCTDGYEGFDCNTPLCRHLQPDGTVSSCSNGGICESKDACDCIRVQSMLVNIYPESPAGQTGWTGSDCTIPICVQGFYDPFCTDLPEAPAGQGCYRCANGGNCTAPDVCTCAEGWSGFDCKTPLCEVVADPLTRTQLGSIFEDKIIEFETDPCGVESIYGVRGWKGRKYARGNCTEPNICTCLCKESYSPKACSKIGAQCDGPWQDIPMVTVRDLVSARGPEFTFGSTDCYYGYEGNVNEMDQFVTCHQTIYRPSGLEQYSVEIIAVLVTLGFVTGVTYYFVSARLRQKFILAKIERRRSKRSSEESLLGNKRSKRSTRRSSAD